MKKLEITPEHMAKIFDMCHYFYPENIVEGTVIINGNILFRVLNEERKPQQIQIHWFELCLTHLSSKIIFDVKKPMYFCKDSHARMLDQLMRVFFEEDKGIHPVDLLHDKFLLQQKKLEETVTS